MRREMDSSEASRRIGEMGEILSRGVELWLKCRKEDAQRKEKAPPAQGSDPLLSVAQREVLQLALKFDKISTADILENTEMSRSTARRRLAELVDSGELTAEGKGRGVRYRLASKPRN